MILPFHYHTRHIPIEHLKLTTRTAATVIDNGLSSCLDPGNIDRLVEFGVDTVELRLVWWELENRKGYFDWSRFDRDLERVEKAGLKAGLMAWFNHSPSWYKGVNFKCIRHGFESTTLSPWAPETLGIMDRLYQKVSERYGSRIDFVYVTSCGDYGEPVLPQGVEHYIFSSPHSHGGLFWTGDDYARKAWAQRSSISIEELLSSKDRSTILDYVYFVNESTAEFTANCYKIIRKYFPHARYGIPLGFIGEGDNGHAKSLVIKKMAEISPNFTARWTGMAVMRNFGKSNVIANRVSSAARFYGATFGEEAALVIESDNAKNALYECIANGSSMLHNDYMNITRSGDESIMLARDISCSEPVTDTALLWPDIDEKVHAILYEGTGNEMNILYEFIDSAAELRKHTNYDIVDSRMIADGVLKKYRELITLTEIPTELSRSIEDFRLGDGAVSSAHSAQALWDGIYRTKHKDYISKYNTKTQEIIISKIDKQD